MRRFSGQLSNERLLDDEDPTCAQRNESELPFYPSIRARWEARKCFNEALMQERLVKITKQRPRVDDEAKFDEGDQVESHATSLQKGLSGKRGPVDIEKIKDGHAHFQ